jgi:malate/lactate dehydrogenase
VKVTIVGGAGGVGSSTAFNLVLLQGGHEIVLVDRRPEMITSHLMDLEQVLELSPGCTVNEGAAADLPDSDVVVVISASPLVAGMSRLDYLAKNARIVDELGDLLDPAWPGILLVVTNPVDPLVTRLHRGTGLDRRRIVGYTINDSLRLRTGVAKALGTASGTVEAWAVGEHGDLSVPLLDRVTVNGSPVELTPEQAAVALDYFRNWYVRHVALDSGRSSTWTSGFALARMVNALDGPGELWPASVVLDGEYGIAGVAVSVPVTLGARGVELIHEWELAPSDLAALRASAQYVRTAVESSEE